MKYIKNNYKNLLILLFGLMVLSLGSTIIITSNFGADSITIFSQGLSIKLNIEYGYAYILGSLFFFIFVLIFDRKRVGVGTIFASVLTGIFINTFLKVLPLRQLDNNILNFLFSFSGLVVVSLGLALYMYSNTGYGAFEGFVDMISNKVKLKFGYVKIIFDAILFTLGIIMGGVFGISSILSIIVIGPLIDVFMFFLKKTNIITEKTLEEENPR